MLGKDITTLMFDLDGTLLPMDLEDFTNTYFSLLAKKAAPYGYEPKALVAAVWKGTKAMIMNDGSRPNDQRFWEVFAGESPGKESGRGGQEGRVHGYLSHEPAVPAGGRGDQA